jgi:hypothetical protein
MVEGHQALFAQPGVDQGGLADVGAAGHGQADRDAPDRPRLVVFVLLFDELGERRLQQAADALPVCRRHRVGSPMPSS